MPQKMKQPLSMVDGNAGTTKVTQHEKPSAKSEARSESIVPVPQIPKSIVPVPQVPKSKKRTADSEHSVPAAKRTKAAKAAPDCLDVSGVSLPGEQELDVPVYDTCDVIRRKIRACIAKDGVTQAAFMRAIATAALYDGRKIHATSFGGFMRQKGPLDGNCNVTFYAAYVFFEKLRIKEGKPKTADREVMERAHRGGVDIKRQAGSVWVGPGESVSMDKYGVLHFSRR